MVERMIDYDDVCFLPLRDTLFIGKPNQSQPHNEEKRRD